MSAVETEIARIAGLYAGRIGLAACHLESGATIGLNAAEGFPMASTVKVPLAMAVLERVDRGELALTRMIDIAAQEMNPSGPLGEEFFHPGVALSVANLIEPMITRSDNTATDVLFRLVGGPAGVADYMARLGVSSVTCSRTIRDLLVALYDMPQPGQDRAVRDVLREAAPQEVIRMRAHATNPDPAYSGDPRDQATPAGMLDLLARLHRGDALAPASRDLLLAIMRRTSTGVRRIQGRLPPGTVVANKTGSASGTCNDVGFVTLPGGLGTLAMAVYVTDSPLPSVEREDAIADLARICHDWAVLRAG